MRNLSIFLSLWFLVNLIQSYFTPIHYDEAYYFKYSEYLDWGYFDHPPMVALLIKIGTLFFSKELGVRILSVILGTAGQYIIWLLLDKPKINIFYVLLAFSMVMINAYSFIMTPDVPLLFFALLFLFFYKQYLKRPNLQTALILGVLAALILYSKYHGILFLIIILISNPNLFKQRSFYAIPLLSLLLYLPHILWQFNHEFPTLKYHLVGRSNHSNATLNYFLEYWPNQFLVFSPFLFIFFLIAAYRSNGDQFLKANKFIFFGFLSFFFFMNFKGHVEPHWTLIAHPSAFILFYVFQKKFYKKLYKQLALLTTILILISRIIILGGFIPKLGFNNYEATMKEIEDNAEAKVVAVEDSYQIAALYHFYTNKPSFSTHSADKRKSQYTLWDFDKKYKNILWLDRAKQEDQAEIKTYLGNFNIRK